MAGYAILEAPSALGLSSDGVEQLPAALLDAGFAAAIRARHAGRVEPPAAAGARDPSSGVRNAAEVRDYAYKLAAATGEVLSSGQVPVVLGGDCSILLGNLLALLRRGRHGLLFVDGHADFYQPEAEPNGEAASMDLAFATGRGPDIVTRFGGYQRLVRDADVVQLGRRDAEEAADAGSQRIEDTPITVIDLATLRRTGVERSLRDALERLARDDLEGFWVHLDCDVLDDALMPAVDYRLPGGLSWEELEAILTLAVGHDRAVGLEVTIFNPTLDADGSVCAALASCLSGGLRVAARMSR